jgi:hypothetical protein
VSSEFEIIQSGTAKTKTNWTNKEGMKKNYMIYEIASKEKNFHFWHLRRNRERQKRVKLREIITETFP